MNSISEQLLQAIEVIADDKVSQLEFDKTIQATVFRIVNLDSGEYKVRYKGNIFSAFTSDLKTTYKIDDLVYVTVPEGNFSNKKLITGLVSSQSLQYNQLAALQNSIFEVSPELNDLYGGNLYQKNEEAGVIAGAAVGASASYKFIYNGPNEFEPNGFHGLFQQYANKYELIRIQANFNTRFYNVHNKGNYGIEVEFYAKGNDIVSYRLDLNAFNGDPYCLSVYSPQSVIIKVQKNYLLGLKSIKLFEEDFVYDKIIENGLVTDKENTTVPNIFVKDVSLQYVEQKDLTDTNYYLTISTPQGTAFTSNVSSLNLQGRLIYQGKDIMNDTSSKCKWFVRNLTVMIGDEEYDKEAGFGWRPLPQTSSLLSLVANDVLYQQRYKLVVTYNETVSLSAEVEIFNYNQSYDYDIEQHTNGDIIDLQLINKLDNGVLVGDWYLSYPDGKYIELDNGKKQNTVSINQYLKYSSVVFYCQIYDLTNTNIIGTIEHTIVNSESSEDITISYIGEDTFRYDANGDIAIEDSEKERTLQVNLAWKEGFGTAYTIQWVMRDQNGKETIITGNKIKPNQSMIDELWVDNYNILHYNIKQKYKVNFNNNTLIVKIKTITEQEYTFSKEILFLKDGDQGTNGTTYVIAVRPCDSGGLKLSGLQPLIYNNSWLNNLPLRCYVYKDGEFINNNSNYTIKYKWTGINILCKETADADIITAKGQGTISSGSNSADLQFYVKIQVSIDDKMNDRETQIYATYPIDVAVGGIDVSLINIDTIPSYIKYTASGVTPSFYSNDINFIYNEIKENASIESLNTNILTIEEKEGLYYLKPASSFIFENIKENSESNIGILKCEHGSTQYLIHPVIMYLDTYGNEAINGWDGTALDTGGGEYVFAPQIGAGIKDSQNKFTGVVMGKDSVQTKVGLYGYQAGVNTFGLMQDGKAFFGAKSGGGQIIIDGTSATISGGNGGNNSTGMTITLANLNPNRDSDAIRIGAGNFIVKYSGSVTAMSAHILGSIYAKEGRIGCDDRERGGWTITSNRIFSGSGNNTVGLDSTDTGDFRIWAGRSEPGTSYDKTLSMNQRITNPAKFVVTKDGFVYMSEAFVKGRLEADEGKIGGWNIASNKLYSDNAKIGLAASGIYRIWVNADQPLNINNTDLTFNSSSYFWVNSSGKMSCKNAEVRGGITATSLYIGDSTTNVVSGNGLSGDALNDGAVSSTKIRDGAITVTKISDGAVSTTKIQGGAITTEKIRADAVTAEKISSNAISTQHLQANAITSSKIQAGAITSNKIEAGAITTSKIAAGAITATEISSNYIYTGSLSASQIKSGTMSANRIQGGTIEGINIKGVNITGSTFYTDDVGDGVFVHSTGMTLYGVGHILMEDNGLEIGAYNFINLACSNVYVNNKTIATQEWVKSYIASQS